MRSVKRIVVTGATIAACGAIAACAANSGSGDKNKSASNHMTISCWASVYADVFKKDIIPAFEKEHDVSIDYVAQSSGPLMVQLQAAKGHPKIDDACLSSDSFETAKELGLVAKNDDSVVTNLSHLRDYAKSSDDIGVNWGEYVLGISYDKDALAANHVDAPQQWNDLLSDKYKDHLSFSDFTGSYGPETLVAMARANGGGVDDIDPGFTAMSTLGKNAVTITGTDFTQLYSQHEIWVAPWSISSTLTTVQNTDLPLEFVYPTDGVVASGSPMAVVEGSAHEKLAQEFLNYLLTPDVQKIIAEKMNVTPTVDGLDLPEDVAKSVGYTGLDFDQAIAVDWKTFADHKEDWTQRWNTEVQ